MKSRSSPNRDQTRPMGDRLEEWAWWLDRRPALIVVLLAAIPLSAAQGGDGVDQADAKAALLEAYPGLFTISGNTVTWSDGATMVWDDGKARTAEELIKSPDIEDMFHYVYPTASAGDLVPDVDFDPGRIRNEAFFKKLYGASAAAVGHHLTSVKWLPQTGQVSGSDNLALRH